MTECTERSEGREGMPKGVPALVTGDALFTAETPA
jgi:hypothetical protein